MKIHWRNDFAVEILQLQGTVRVKIHTGNLVEQMNIGKNNCNDNNHALLHY